MASLNGTAAAPVEWPQGGILTLEWIGQLRSTLEYATRNLKPTELPSILPGIVADQIIAAASKILHKEANCVDVEVNPRSRVVLVGDVHGQFHDVLHLLDVAGEPTSDRIFVFNGDYVDRGAWGLETYIFLLCWKVLCIQFPFSIPVFDLSCPSCMILRPCLLLSCAET